MLLDLTNSIEKSSYEKKWLIETMLVFSFGGLYFNFDAPLALHQELKTYFANDPEVGPNFAIYYNRLYGALAWPNIFMPFVIGALSDKYGNRILLISLALCGLLGQFTMWMGCI
jgi:MFS family permease